MTSGTGDEGSAANVLRKAVEVVGLMRRCLVSHSVQRGPTFNACLSAGMDPGSVLHVNLRPVQGFSGGGQSILLHWQAAVISESRSGCCFNCQKEGHYWCQCKETLSPELKELSDQQDRE